MEKINGGLSNDVFKYKNLLFKFYNYSQLKLNYNWEQTIQTKLYSTGLNTPKIHQSIEVDGKLIGRVEHFIDATPISINEFRHNYKNCASILKKIHETNLEGLSITNYGTLDYKLEDCIKSNNIPDFFNYIDQWTNTVLDIKSQNLDYQILSEFDSVYQSGQIIKNNINKMCKELGTSKVISHNDFQQLNLLSDSNNNWYIIDFEYSSLNYPYYDIANYFAECALNNFELKYYPNLYPSKESRFKFYSYYFDLNEKLDFEKIDGIIKEFAKLVEYTWFIWSVIKYHNSKSIDYLDYGLIRKNNFIKLIG